MIVQFNHASHPSPPCSRTPTFLPLAKNIQWSIKSAAFDQKQAIYAAGEDSATTDDEIKWIRYRFGDKAPKHVVSVINKTKDA